jgi:two-component system NtrC family sensor kinase
VTGLLIFTLIRSPVNKLTEGTRAIAKGDLDYTIPLQRKDEIGELSDSFNSMTRELKKAREDLSRIQNHMIQMEKMASLGKLSATVAHELNNPLSGILTYAKLVKRRLTSSNLSSEKLKSIQDDLSMIADETTRCGNVVKNLLLFSKREIEEFAVIDLHQILDRCTQLLEHHLGLNNIQLIKNYKSKNSECMCDKNKIQQAFLAILMNAIEAMPDGGTLTIGTKDNPRKKTSIVEIQDSGIGIPSEDIPRIFEPFFTTKKEGKGVGLGLSVVYGILDAHNAEINVKSKVGGGSTFIVELPCNLNVGENPSVKSQNDSKRGKK